MELPELALIKVLSNFTLYDQLTICRLVCKRWKLLIEQDILANSRNELVLFVRMLQVPMVWSHSQQAVRLDESIVVNRSIKNSQHFRNLFTNLKSLFIALFEPSLEHLDLCDIVHSFPSLEHLEIRNLFYEYCPISTGHLRVDLNHSNLRTLHLGYKDQIVNLNCPALTELNAFGVFHVDERCCFRNSLKFLKVRSFTHQPDCILPNLEVLCFADNLEIDLEAFKKLKEIHYYSRELEIGRDREEHGANVNRILESLIQRKRRLRLNLEIYKDGVRRKTEADRWPFRPFPEHGSLELTMEELASILKNFDEPTISILKSKFHTDNLLFDEERDQTTDDPIEHLARSIQHLILPYFTFYQNFEMWVERRDGVIFERPVPGPLPSIPMPGVRATLFDPPFNPSSKHLFSYVNRLQLAPSPQNLMQMLPDLMTNVLDFRSMHGYKFEGRILNYSFLSEFRALKRLSAEKDWLSIDVLRKIFANCKFIDYLTIILDKFSDLIQVYPKENGQYGIWFAQNPPGDQYRTVPSKAGLLDYLQKNRIVKPIFFDDFFSHNYYLVNDDSDEFDDEQILPNFQMSPEDYFHDQSH